MDAYTGEVDVRFLEENHLYVNPMGSKGIVELGIVGIAAAISNAVYNATGSGFAICRSRPTSCWSEP